MEDDLLGGRYAAGTGAFVVMAIGLSVAVLDFACRIGPFALDPIDRVL